MNTLDKTLAYVALPITPKSKQKKHSEGKQKSIRQSKKVILLQTMDFNLNSNNDNYNIQCGVVYLTIRGGIIFSCTLCENNYQEFHIYAQHIAGEHSPIINIDEIGTFHNEGIQNDSTDDYCLASISKDSEQDYFEILEEQNSYEIEYADSLHSINNKIEMRTDIEQSKVTYSKRVHLYGTNDGDLRKFKCTECNFSCKEYKNLVGHMKRHSEHRPHQCSECSKAFYTTCELRTHFRSHTGERPYLCNECGQGFVTAGKLGEHMKRHKNRRDKACSLCRMKFFNTQSLRRHLTTHSQDRLHKCTICSNSFKRRTSLINHMKLHINKLEYKCELCSAKFNQKPGLYSHMKTKHSLIYTATNNASDICVEHFKIAF